jgi:molybdopterin-containing oxidoreductase family molybdopterin binding subunit
MDERETPEVVAEEPVEDEESLLHTKFGRRAFVGGTVAVGGAVAVASHTGLLGSTSKPVVRALTPGGDPAPGLVPVKEQVFNDVCSPNCWQGCYLKAHVRNGRLTKTAMNPFPETRYNRICLRGLSHAQWVYHPARLKFPMKRVGPRGSGKWRRITWDQAATEIASGISRIQSTYGKGAFAIFTGSGNYGAVNGSFGYAPVVFANLIEATQMHLAVDQALGLGVTQVGLGEGFVAGNEPLDMSNADLLVMWGNNLTESQVQEWHFVADAKDRGAQLVVIDPNFSITASKADKWIPLRPGSDPAFGLSVLNVLIAEKLYDEAFVMAHTTLSFLVRDDDGMFLRAADGKTILAWDPSTKSAQPADSATHPALTGSYTVNGVTVRPAFARLAERVATWTPEYAQQFTEVAPSDVRWFARTYAATKKSFIFASMGVDRWNNAFLNGRCIATMASLTHNFGQPGAAIGDMGGSAFMDVYMSGYLLFSPTGTLATPLPSWQGYEAIATGKTHILAPLDGKDPAKGVTKDPVEVDWPIKAIWFSASNAVSNTQQSTLLIRLLRDESKLELVVVSDSMPTDTVRYADIVLPATHWFENDDVVGGLHPYLFEHERAIEPAFEAKGDYDIFGLVAGKLDFGQFYSKSQREVANDIVSGIGTKVLGGAAGASFVATYQKTGAARVSPLDYVGNATPVFTTPTGRLEIYSERVVVNYPAKGWIPITAGVDPLPYWQPPIEAWPDNPLYKKYPLVYMTEHTRWRVHTTYFDQPWLREIDPEPYVDLSHTDAKARGIVQGDYVEVFNDRGKTVAVARVSGKMRQGMVSLPKGWQRFQTKDDTGYSDPTYNWVNQLTSNGSYFDNLVEVRKVVV